jgi:hypothetical protein
MKRIPRFTKAEIQKLAGDFIDHFGELHEIREELASLRILLDEKLTHLIVATGARR